jgi:hypothetical protein
MSSRETIKWLVVSKYLFDFTGASPLTTAKEKPP